MLGIKDEQLLNTYQNPQRLMMRIIKMFSNEGDWILDLFSGTGMFLDFSLQKYILIGCQIEALILFFSW